MNRRPGGEPGVSAARPDGRRRVCLYYPWLYLTSGGERTIVEIARRSRHQIRIVTNEYQPEATFPDLRAFDITVLRRVPVKRTIGSVGLAAWRLLTQRIDLSEFEALIVVCEGLGDLVVLRHPRVPAFCLCLTPLRIAFDPRYRETYFRSRGLANRLVVKAGAAAFAAVDRVAWRRYTRVFAISREVRSRILAGRLAPPEKLRLLHPGVDVSAYTPTGRADRVFFVPGRIMWTKNLELAIEAFRAFRTQVADPGTWRLCIAGIVDAKSRPYLERLQHLAGGDPAIEFHIRPDDRTMREMYASAFAVLFTAFNEDWGLVILEAMASGVPPVACNRGGPREIVRHEHDGLLVDGSPAEMSAGMLRLAQDPQLRNRLAAAGPDSARRYDWSAFVEEIDDAIDRAVDAAAPVAADAWRAARASE